MEMVRGDVLNFLNPVTRHLEMLDFSPKLLKLSIQGKNFSAIGRPRDELVNALGLATNNH